MLSPPILSASDEFDFFGFEDRQVSKQSTVYSTNWKTYSSVAALARVPHWSTSSNSWSTLSTVYSTNWKTYSSVAALARVPHWSTSSNSWSTLSTVYSTNWKTYSSVAALARVPRPVMIGTIDGHRHSQTSSSSPVRKSGLPQRS